MTKGDWFNQLFSYALVLWWLWIAQDKPLETRMLYYVAALIVVIRTEAKRIRIEAKADG